MVEFLLAEGGLHQFTVVELDHLYLLLGLVQNVQ